MDTVEIRLTIPKPLANPVRLYADLDLECINQAVRDIACPNCEGTGLTGRLNRTCPDCGGNGWRGGKSPVVSEVSEPEDHEPSPPTWRDTIGGLYRVAFDARFNAWRGQTGPGGGWVWSPYMSGGATREDGQTELDTLAQKWDWTRIEGDAP